MVCSSIMGETEACETTQTLLNATILHHPSHDHSPTEYVRVIVSKASPTRATGYEIAHFVMRDGELTCLTEPDLFLPSINKAARWVLEHYASARLTMVRKAHDGHLAAICFECEMSDVLNHSGRHRKSSA